MVQLALFYLVGLLLPFASNAAPVDTVDLVARSSCHCGYVMTKYNNAYFPLRSQSDFSSASNGPVASLQDFGFKIDQGQIGSVSPSGTLPSGSTSNLRFNNGALELIVPGGQSTRGSVTGAEISFQDLVTGGVFTINAQLDSTPGTCQSLFTYHDWTLDVGDEQDIEVVSGTIFNSAPNGTPPGIQLTNFDPDDSSQSTSVSTVVPFPTDPTKAFHNYTIAWVPGGTKYAMDNKALKSPNGFSSVHASSVVINHWSNGDPDFTQGPPSEDVVMKVKSIDFFYKTSQSSSLPAGCSLSQACRI